MRARLVGRDGHKAELLSGRADRFGQSGANFFDVTIDLLCLLGFDGYFRRLNPAWEKAEPPADGD